MSDRLTTEIPSNVDVLAQQVKLPLSGKVAPNRFLKAAMTEKMSSYDDKEITKRGIPSPELIHLYEEWGKGGFGIILSGNTFGQYEHLEAPGNMIMRGDEPERFEAFKKLAAASKAHGSLHIVQLSHGGRQTPANVTQHPVSASDIQLTHMGGNDVTGNFGKPRALSIDDIKETVQEFANAAKYAYDTGADGVQLHGAHGYLLAQFLSTTTNQRTDQYGGSLENRSRIIIEILDAVRAKVPDPKFSLGIKLNSVEFQAGGFSTEDCKKLCAQLEEHGVEFIELSGGTYEELAFGPSKHQKRESTKKREGYFVEFADEVRHGIKKAQIYVTGGFRTAKGMADAVESSSCVGVGLGRPVCSETDLPKKILNKQAASARKSLIPEDEFLTANQVCCYQLKQVGSGQGAFDWNDEKQLQPVLKELGLA